jgi:hypothetical protein
MSGETTFERILKLELDYCAAPSIVGMGGHLEIVGEKLKRKGRWEKPELVAWAKWSFR